MKYLHIVSFVLLAVGGLNWLLYAFNYNLVNMIFGSIGLEQAVYILVGLAAIYEVATHKSNCRDGGSQSM